MENLKKSIGNLIVLWRMVAFVFVFLALIVLFNIYDKKILGKIFFAVAFVAFLGLILSSMFKKGFAGSYLKISSLYFFIAFLFFVLYLFLASSFILIIALIITAFAIQRAIFFFIVK